MAPGNGRMANYRKQQDLGVLKSAKLNPVVTKVILEATISHHGIIVQAKVLSH